MCVGGGGARACALMCVLPAYVDSTDLSSDISRIRVPFLTSQIRHGLVLGFFGTMI